MRTCQGVTAVLLAVILGGCVKSSGLSTAGNQPKEAVAHKQRLTEIRRAFIGMTNESLQRLVPELHAVSATGSVHFDASERTNPESPGHCYPNVVLANDRYAFTVNVFGVVMDVDLVTSSRSLLATGGSAKYFNEADGIREFIEPLVDALSTYTSWHCNRRIHEIGLIAQDGKRVGTWCEFTPDGRRVNVQEYGE